MSMVSVSRRAGPPQIGQVVCRKPSWSASGRLRRSGRNSTSSGASDRQLVLGHRDDAVHRGSRRPGWGSPRSAGARRASRAGGS